MRKLMLLTLILAFGYGGYWVVGSRAVEKNAVAALDGLRDDGWQVSYADLSTHGFPSRFDTTLSEFSLQDPASGWGWRAPFVQALALSYLPNKVIVAFAPDQTVSLPGGDTLTITSQGFRASGSVSLGTEMALDRVTAEVGHLRLLFGAGPELSAERGLLAIRPSGDDGLSYDAYAELADITPPADWVAVVAPDNSLPPRLSLINIDTTLRFDRPLNRYIGTNGAPALTRIEIRTAHLGWGKLAVNAQGTLDIDAAGLPSGTVTVVAQDWQRMIDLAVQAGVIDPEFAPTWRHMGQSLADGNGALNLPVTFRAGGVYVGLILLGPAPRFR